jgi:hypothetical protein
LYCEIDGLAIEIQTQDLSTAGLFVQTPSPPPVDSEVAVFLHIGTARVEAFGHVVQSISYDTAKRERRRAGFGLLFTRIEDGARAELRDALDTLTHAASLAANATHGATPESGVTREPERSASAPARARTSADPGPRDAPENFARRVSQPARSSASPTIDPKEREILAQLQAELAGLESQPPWTILGISQGADEAAARCAFFAASKRYHPHSYARYTLPEIKTVVTQLFITYKRAFTTMTKPGRGARNGLGSPAAKSGNPSGRSSDPGNR